MNESIFRAVGPAEADFEGRTSIRFSVQAYTPAGPLTDWPSDASTDRRPRSSGASGSGRRGGLPENDRSHQVMGEREPASDRPGFLASSDPEPLEAPVAADRVYALGRRGAILVEILGLISPHPDRQAGDGG